MNEIRSFITAFCTGLVMLGALYIIVPNGNVKKQVKYAFCLAFLVIVLSAGKIVNFDGIDFKSNLNNNIDSERLLSVSAEMAIKSALSQNEITFKEITVCTDKSEKDGIFISKVIIKTDAEKNEVLKIFKGAQYTVEVLNE